MATFVAGGTLLVPPFLAHAGFHLRFQVTHGFMHGVAAGVEHILVFGHGVEQRHRLWHRKSKIVADSAIILDARRELLATPGMAVVAQRMELRPRRSGVTRPTFARFQLTANPNLPLSRDLKKAGVEVFVCGQSLHERGFKAAAVAEEVPVADSALLVLVNKQVDGYAYIPAR
jgi:hypothetical protein